MADKDVEKVEGLQMDSFKCQLTAHQCSVPAPAVSAPW